MKIIPKDQTKEISKQWFNHGYAQLLMYLNDHVGIDIDKEYVSGDGFLLGEWISKVRTLWIDDLLSQKQIYQLEQVGLSKREESQNWESIYRYAKNYYMDYSVLPFGRSYRTSDGVILGAWLDRQRRLGYLLSDEQKEKLREIGINVEGERDGD